MALELPDWLTDAFNLIGLPWPGIDEDQLHGWARDVRQFADSVVDNSSQTNQTMRELADSSQSSVVTGVAQQYERHHRLLTELHGPMNDFAQGLDYAADAVVAQKWIVIGAASALAAEFTATQIGAIFTLGADEAALPAEVISTRTIVKFALKDLEAVVIGRLINWGAQELSDHVNHSIVTLANDAWGMKMETTGLKIAHQKVSDAAAKMRGQADTAEETGNRAHSQSTSRSLEDSGGASGWAEVINALKQGLLDIASDLFKSLPSTIARVLRDIAGLLERFAAKLKGADEEGGPAVTAGGRGRTPEAVPPKYGNTKSLLPRYRGEEIPGNSIWPGGSAVRYLSESEREAYKLTVRDGKLYDAEGNLFDTSGAHSLHSSEGRAIFVMDHDGNIYASTEHSFGKFHHSSFLAGGNVAGAGELQVSDGELKLVSDQSGHYQPTRDVTTQVVQELRSRGVPVNNDMVQLIAPP